MKAPETYAFSALLSRMKYISRWGLMRSGRPENVSEHTAETAHLAHLLALIAKVQLGDDTITPERVAVTALYHDASEILTGDMPTPVKYKSEELRSAYKAVERESAAELAHLLPPDLEDILTPYLTGEVLNDAERTLLKAADRLCALVKCIEEEAAGNREFASAKRQQMHLLRQMDCAAANIFLEHYLPCYEKNLDELIGRE